MKRIRIYAAFRVVARPAFNQDSTVANRHDESSEDNIDWATAHSEYQTTATVVESCVGSPNGFAILDEFLHADGRRSAFARHQQHSVHEGRAGHQHARRDVHERGDADDGERQAELRIDDGAEHSDSVVERDGDHEYGAGDDGRHRGRTQHVDEHVPPDAGNEQRAADCGETARCSRGSKNS